MDDTVTPPSGMQTWAFTDYDIGNSRIVPSHDHSSLSFTIRTERGFMDMQKFTTLTAQAGGTEDLGGAIDWKKKTMTINGVTKQFAEVQHKLGGALSLLCEWQWSTKKYKVDHKKRTWTAKCGEEPIAVFTPLKRHPFKKDELPTLDFISDVHNEEIPFLILILLFADLKLPPSRKPKSAKAASGDAAVKLGVTIVGNVVSNACTIQ